MTRNTLVSTDSTRRPKATPAALVTLATALALAGCAAPANGSGPAQASNRAPAPAPAPAPATAATPAAALPSPPQPGALPLAPTAAQAAALATGSDADHIAGFAVWNSAFQSQALQAGIRPDTVRNVLATAQWQPRVVELDRAQPEFTRTPWAYLDSAVSPQRVAQGQAKLAEHSAALQAASARYGVPATVITAIWGMESNYGSNFGTFRTVDALATLAYEGRRRAWAQNELLAALRIIDQGDIAADRMIGSWAGAMGHTQFLPSVFLRHAVDADGDGHRDIWGSVPDVAASTAAFLAGEGWRRGESWGTEVQLPAGFDHARTELSVRQSAVQWAAEGVQTMDGRPLPALEAASILAPAGARGPAFLVGHNFRTLLRYNNAVTYALGVAQLSQQIDGGAPIIAAWPRDLPALSRDQVLALQVALNERGFDTGTPDGVLGPATRAGLRRYQQSEGLVADGYATADLLARLRGAATPAAPGTAPTAAPAR
ncbi:lytic murein transglycosylase [Acidovorax sp. NPDC077693]|uniref:lytic murein transglycosylase n=1 Tax=unclassified Acidovorax TaxID=2684926 RepID=UPI0037C56954